MDRSEYLKASPPMFKSGLLDRFTRVHHLVPVAHLPARDRAAVRGRHRAASGLLSAVLYAVGGYAFWTLAEYWIHRGIFHFEPEQGFGARLHWMVHGVHHDHPNDPLRLVMPPAASVPLALVFYALFWLVLGPERGDAFGAGFLGRLPGLRHDPLPPAPPHADDAGGPVAARAAHAPPLPGRHARLRDQRAVLGPRVRDHVVPPRR